MRKFLLIIVVLFFAVPCFAGNDFSKQATAFYSDNNYNKTLEMLLQIDENDRTAQDWLLLGNLMDEKGQRDDAVFMYQKAINTEPKFYKSYYNLANIYLRESRNNMAVQNYKTALKYNKTNPYIYYNLGCAYLRLGKTKDAKNAFIKAVTLKNDIPEVHYNLAYVYKQLNKPKTAKIYLDNYNKLKPEY